jgi:hypothetical protein
VRLQLREKRSRIYANSGFLYVPLASGVTTDLCCQVANGVATERDAVELVLTPNFYFIPVARGRNWTLFPSWMWSYNRERNASESMVTPNFSLSQLQLVSQLTFVSQLQMQLQPIELCSGICVNHEFMFVPLASGVATDFFCLVANAVGIERQMLRNSSLPWIFIFVLVASGAQLTSVAQLQVELQLRENVMNPC